jgi:uncharacterized membrane protein YgcG
MEMIGPAASARGAPPQRVHDVQRATLVVMVIATLLLGALASAAPASARGLALQLRVKVVAPDGSAGPPPTGRIAVALDGRRLVAIPLTLGAGGTALALPWIVVELSLTGHELSVGYSGDANYEGAATITVAAPTRDGVTIVAQPRDRAAPEIAIASPRAGARYERGEAVLAAFDCADPGARSAVTACDGTVAAGGPIDTSTAGTFSFTVRARDGRGNAATRTVSYVVEPSTSRPAATSGSGTVDRGAGPAAAAPPPPPSPTGAAPAATPAAGAALAAGPAAGATSRRASAPPARRAAGRGHARRVRGVAARPLVAPVAGASRQVFAGPNDLERLPSYDPRAEPSRTLAILVAAFTLLQLASAGGGLALARGATGGGGSGGGTGGGGSGGDRDGRPADGRARSSGPRLEYRNPGVDVRFLGAGFGAVALGDRSRTWAWPGTRTLDALGASVPGRVARRSPLIARVAADGTYLRAILGSASLLAMLAGVTLGVFAVHDTGAAAMTPVAGLTIAIAVLGVLDAAAGLAAALTFATGVLLLGGVSSGADVREMLGIAALWSVVPLLAGAARPLRRPPATSMEESWDRAADFVIASLIGAWAVHGIVLSLPGLAGVRLPIAAHADAVSAYVLAGLVLRLGLETIASHLYPRRLDLTEAADVPEPGLLQSLVSSVLRTAVFAYVAYQIAGDTWQLGASAAMFLVPRMLWVVAPRLPNSRALYRARPKGIVSVVLTLVVCAAIGALLISTTDTHAEDFFANALVALSLAHFVFALLAIFGRDGEPPPLGWGKRVAGIAILLVGVLQAFGLLL